MLFITFSINYIIAPSSNEKPVYFEMISIEGNKTSANSRNTRQGSSADPFKRNFCRNMKYYYPRSSEDAIVDICRATCKSDKWRKVATCAETVFERRCGCNEHRGKIIGRMKYEVSAILLIMFVCHIIVNI